MARDFFISYATENKDYVQKLVKELEELGYLCWVSCRDIGPLDKWDEAIVNSLKVVDFFILILSSFSASSKHVQREVRMADDQDLPLICVKLEDIPMSAAISYYFAGTEYIPAFEHSSIKETVDKISKSISNIKETIYKISKSISGQNTTDKSTRKAAIWMINLDPTIGAEIQKIRPAVIVSEDALGVLPLRVVVPLTRWKDRFRLAPWIVCIEPDTQNGLEHTSAADALQIRSVAQQRFVRKVGLLQPEQVKQVLEAIQVVVGAV